ncbi:MAG: hypothetical protein NC251_05040 [Lachnoclostridium sp.]|nr:hypothetical protein [Lachnospira sp.]MCM1247778.1 hypothetical protein [Lachnoclostridium sp.]
MRKKMLAAVLLGACFLLGGCTSREEAAKKLLEERYGEEFVVHQTWSSGDSYAVCSPKNNRNVVFELRFSEDVGKIWNDRYVSNVVSLQISEKLQKELGKYFPDCYVHVQGDYNVGDSYLGFSDIQSVTPEMYIERYPRADFTVRVYVEKEKLRSDTIEKEYLYFSESLQEEMENGKLPRLTILVYYVDSEQKSRLRNYFKSNDWEGDAAYKDIVGSKSFDWGISYCEHGRPVGKIDVTYEEYEEMRRGGN